MTIRPLHLETDATDIMMTSWHGNVAFDFNSTIIDSRTVYPKKYAHGFVVLCFAVVMQSFIMNSPEVFIHIHQGCFAGTGAIIRLPQCQWSKPDGYGKINQYITTTKHSKAKTVCIFLGIYCNSFANIAEVSWYRTATEPTTARPSAYFLGYTV